ENENEKLRRENEKLRHEKELVEKEKEKLRQEPDRLKDELDLARRAAKRQAAPFSKGEPKTDPRRPGRKPGVRYGRKGHRAIPPIVDEEIKVPLPERSPCCGGAMESRHVEDQYQTEIVRQTRVTCFHIQVGNCAKCGKRIQGRDSRQTSDALGAAASQVGPEALSLATILNKELGMPLGKTTAVLDKAFGLTLTPGGLSQAQPAGCQGQAKSLVQNGRGFAQGHPQFFVQDGRQRQGFRTHLRGGRSQGVGGLAGITTLDSFATFRAVADLDMKTGHPCLAHDLGLILVLHVPALH